MVNTDKNVVNKIIADVTEASLSIAFAITYEETVVGEPWIKNNANNSLLPKPNAAAAAISTAGSTTSFVRQAAPTILKDGLSSL